MVGVVIRWARLDGLTDGAGAVHLSERERSRLVGLSRSADRRRFVGAHLLVRQVVGLVGGCDPAEVVLDQICADCGGPHGRPTVQLAGEPGPEVSIAHADELAIVAVGHRAVGVDLEPLAGVRAGLADVVLGPGERLQLDGLGPADADRAVLASWVRKEAVLKATGHGLAVDPARVELSAGPDPRLVAWTGPAPCPEVRLADLDVAPGYLAAVARLGIDDLAVDAGPVILDRR